MDNRMEIEEENFTQNIINKENQKQEENKKININENNQMEEEKDDKILEFNEFMVLCELGIADITRKKI